MCTDDRKTPGYATGLDLIGSMLQNILAQQSSTMATHTDRMRQIVWHSKVKLNST